MSPGEVAGPKRWEAHYIGEESEKEEDVGVKETREQGKEASKAQAYGKGEGDSCTAKI